jgi:hypothetical protein
MLNLSPNHNSSAEAKCSRAGCAAAAEFQVVWRNPKIHSEERRKIWLACLEHRDYLVDYLAVRSFFIETLAIS